MNIDELIKRNKENRKDKEKLTAQILEKEQEQERIKNARENTLKKRKEREETARTNVIEDDLSTDESHPQNNVDDNSKDQQGKSSNKLILIFFIAILTLLGVLLLIFFTNFMGIKSIATDFVINSISKISTNYIETDQTTSNANIQRSTIDDLYQQTAKSNISIYNFETDIQFNKWLATDPDLNLKDANGMTPLLVSIANNKPAIVQRLIQTGANINTTDDWGNTALMYATKHANKNSINTILTNGADINRININGETALSLAAENGKFETTKLLLEAGADPFITDNLGQDPVENAVIFNHIDTANLVKKYQNMKAIAK